MKKAVTVFVVLTPVAFLVWALAFCLAGIMDGNMAGFIPYISDMKAGLVTLFTEFEGMTMNKIIAYVVLGLLGLGLILYFILPIARKRYGYMWHMLLAITATVPIIITLANISFYKENLDPLSDYSASQKVILYFALAAAALTTILMLVCFLLFFIDVVSHRGKKAGLKLPKVDQYGNNTPVAPAIRENGLTSKAIPASEPVVDPKKDDPYMQEIRDVVREELAKMHSRLQVRQNVASTLYSMEEEINGPKEAPVPTPIDLDNKDKPKDNGPIKIVIVTDNKEANKPVEKKEPEVIPMVEVPLSEDENVDLLVEPLVEQEPKVVEEPIIEEVPLEEPPLEEPIIETIAPEPVEMKSEEIEEPIIEETEEEISEAIEIEEVEEEATPEEEIEEEVNFEDEPMEVVSEDEVIDEEPEEVMEVTPEEDIPEEPAPVVEDKKEEVAVFEKEPEGLVSEEPAPVFEAEPEPEKVTPVIVPVPASEPEVKPTYERISFMDRMINTDAEMKEHYNILKNEILAYGVKSRVSNSGDAFRLHTKTYVKITIAGKSLKLYFALDPKDYENTTIPIQDAGHKGIYAEIPLVFKVKSDLSMKRAKDLIADAMAKDNLEKGTVEDVDYVEALKDEVATQDNE